MTNRVMGMGAMLGFGIGAIKEQFKTPTSNIKNSNNSKENTDNGFKGIISRAKTMINPSMNLSDEKDYNGNINPIRNVESVNSKATIPKSTGFNKENIGAREEITAKSVMKNIAKTGFRTTKAYLDIGAKMVEGDFGKLSYGGKVNYKNNNLQGTEIINKVANNDELQKLGDENEFKGKSKE